MLGNEFTECKNTDNGATDVDGHGCSIYREPLCGLYDDDDFESKEMCCVCGGGVSGIVYYF